MRTANKCHIFFVHYPSSSALFRWRGIILPRGGRERLLARRIAGKRGPACSCDSASGTWNTLKGISKNLIGWIFSVWANRTMQKDLSVAT